MLQNRVDPLGNVIITKARGAWMGNRGLLHDEHQRVLRPFRLKAWLICLLEFKGRRRPVMAPRQYTELFFLDEATALSAGHRPCAECRRQDFERFKSFWIGGNPEYQFTQKTSIREIDDVLHGERIDRSGTKVTHEAPLRDLPDGVIIIYNGKPHLIARGLLFPWTPFGYGTGMALPEAKTVPVLTPVSTVNAIRAGYAPQMALTSPPTVSDTSPNSRG